ncbi:DNA damage-inducible transcript 4-like protein [Spea bombifrons]|uniref:DNA damage-inducible transcript 4-like protein n=1 Tax=Spea bombifrons TaxID=233779 RepID=UPI00234B0F50|nr:DNA damage-inducible transcript 4-like protein [Spea bombifrons]XP_053317532.1 DNA damage-inducible transcript 4-like protein [Spea bombifrons]
MDHFSTEPNLHEALCMVRTCHLITMLEDCLYKAKRHKLHCSKVLVPKELTVRVAQEVLKLSSNEPCGLRGCVLYVNLEAQNKKINLGKLVYDSAVEPTFELSLLLKQDIQTWDYFRDLINRTCFPNFFQNILKLSPKFMLAKKRLYFSVAETGTDDF